MKKLILLGALLVGAIGVQSCTITEDEYIDNTMAAEVFEVSGTFTAANNYTALFQINPALYDSDHVLVYRLWGQDNGNDVWRLIPNTVFFSNGDEILYNFDHTRYDLSIFLEPTFDLSLTTPEERSAFLNNQIFRIVVVPGTANYKGDFSDYNKTIEMLGLQNAKIKSLPQK